jgi:hypothetical protein
MFLAPLFHHTKIALGAFILLGNATLASGADQLPEFLSEHMWLVEGLRTVASKEVEFAPLTTCYDLNEKFSGQTTTSIQKEREWENYRGKYIPLAGILEEVQGIPLSNDYLAHFKCSNSNSLFVDFTMRIPHELEEYAYSLTPGKKYDVYVKLVNYSEMLGVAATIDIINIDIGNGESCPAKFSDLNRNDGNYQYACENPLVEFDRRLTSYGHPYFGSATEQGETKFGVLYPSLGKEDFLLISKDRSLHYGGHGDDCYIPGNTFGNLAGEEHEEIVIKALTELGGKIALEEVQGLTDMAEVNSAISELDAETYSCEIKQILRTTFMLKDIG